MSLKVIRNLPGDTEKLILKEFSTVVERGEKSYVIRSFSEEEEISVQDSRMALDGLEEPAAIENREDEISDDDYLPPSKLVKGGGLAVGERVEMPKGSASGEFVESSLFSDAQERQSDYPTKILKQEGQLGMSEEQLNLIVAEKNELENKIAELSTAIENKDKEIAEINESLPAKLSEAKEEGRVQGVSEGEAKATKKYIAEKDDYLSKLEIFNKDASSKLEQIEETIKSIDNEITKTVIGFVKTIVGAERKINDAFVTQLIKANMERLRELKIVKFLVNPADVEVMKSAFNGSAIEGDSSIPKGGVKIISKVGEVDLRAESMIADLEKQINETIGTAN